MEAEIIRPDTDKALKTLAAQRRQWSCDRNQVEDLSQSPGLMISRQMGGEQEALQGTPEALGCYVEAPGAGIQLAPAV